MRVSGEGGEVDGVRATGALLSGPGRLEGGRPLQEPCVRCTLSLLFSGRSQRRHRGRVPPCPPGMARLDLEELAEIGARALPPGSPLFPRGVPHRWVRG